MKVKIHALLPLPEAPSDMVFVYRKEKERGLVSTELCSFTAEKEDETVILFGFPCFSLSTLLQSSTDKTNKHTKPKKPTNKQKIERY